MSKQKCRISKKRSNFSIISNSVAQVLNYDLSALGLYVYLFSLPHDWEFHKTHLRKVCNIGEKKLNNLLKILSDHKLINVLQTRKENGQFSHFDIHIDDGSAFIHNPKPDSQNCRPVENGAAVKQSYKENIKNKEHKDQKREPARKKRVALPENFEPNAESKAMAEKKGLDLLNVLTKFMAHAKSEGWTRVDWHEAFMKWVIDEKKITSPKESIKNTTKVNEPRNTTTFWEPGNPDYDRLHGVGSNGKGSEVRRDSVRGKGVRKVEGYLL